MKNMKKINYVAVALLFVLCAIIRIFPAAEYSAQTKFAESWDTWDTWEDTWALEDELGRKAPDFYEAGAINGKKQVGIFYLPDVNSIKIAEAVDPEAPRNVSEIIKNNPDWKYNSNVWGVESEPHYWDEPLYGYYSLLFDEWVIRQHATMLVDAGVDFIIVDLTNYYAEGYYYDNFDWSEVMKVILKVFREMVNEGQKVPKVTCLYTWSPNFNGLAVNDTYDKFIKDNLDLWFYHEGKPLILANDNVVREDIKDMFTYRTVSPYYNGSGLWQWCAIYPQGVGAYGENPKEMMAVSVSQNWTDALSFASAVDEYGRFIARGRSWSSVSGSKMLDTPIGAEWRSEYGYNFQEQFNRAIEIDPDILFVTEWNGWINARFNSYFYQGKGYGLPSNANWVDGYSSEFSRTIEPTKNEYIKDNTYCQLASNVRYYKGVRKSPGYKVIATVNDLLDWSGIPAYYRDNINDEVVRNNVEGAVKKITINNMTGRNDFRQCKVARNNENVYFYAECSDDIVRGSGAFMQLYVKTEGRNGKNWEGYNFRINNSKLINGVAPVESFSGNGTEVLISGYASVKYSGNALMCAVPLKSLGLTADNVEFEFKWFDSEKYETEGNALDFYLYGDAAPNYRFNYVYNENESANFSGTSVNLYDQFSSAESVAMGEADVVGCRFVAEKPFKGVDVAAYATFDNPQEYTLELYEFAESYQKTISARPLMSRRVKNVYDHTVMYLGADMIKAGEYLLLIKDIKLSEGNTAGVYFYEGQNYNVSYFNGLQVNDSSIKARVFYYASEKLVTVTGGRYAAGDSLIIDVPDSYVQGMSLSPVENGTNSFPKEFTVYLSEDGQNYSSANRQKYFDYTATPTEQVFLFKDGDHKKIKKIKVVFDSGGEISGASVLAEGNENEGENNEGTSGCSGKINAPASALFAAFAVFGGIYYRSRKKGEDR